MNRVHGAVKQTFSKVTHAIFDLDGLLLDTEHLYTKANQSVVGKYGKTYSPELKQNILGLTGSDAAKEVVNVLNLPLTWMDYYQLVKEQYPLIMTDTEVMPDTENLYTGIVTTIAKKYGKIYTPEMRAQVTGRVETEGAKIAVTQMKLPISVESYLREYRALTKKTMTSVDFLPGAERLVKHFHSKHVPMAVATSSGRDTYDLKVNKHKAFFSMFSHVVTGGSDPEVERGKPNPDIFLVCASRFKDKPKPNKCLVFEDAPNGVQAAVDAGMQVVMVPDKDLDPKLCKLATLTLKSLNELKPELFGLPPFN